ncbi:MAG: peptidylprolyl isomerase [Halobacteriaceae archaeon]
MPIADGDTVTFEYVGRLPDGTVFDTSRESVAREAGLHEQHPDREYEPLTVEVGAGRIVEGLERELHGLEAGDTATITVAPEDGYGHREEERVVTFDREEFESILQGADPELGMHVQDQQGTMGEVVSVDEGEVDVDFNHELAGETIEFEVEILDIE